MWSGSYWAKSYWAGNYWNPIDGAAPPVGPTRVRWVYRKKRRRKKR